MHESVVELVGWMVSYQGGGYYSHLAGKCCRACRLDGLVPGGGGGSTTATLQESVVELVGRMVLYQGGGGEYYSHLAGKCCRACMLDGLVGGRICGGWRKTPWTHR